MRFSQRAMKDFFCFFFIFFFWVLFPSCHIKEGYAYVCIQAHISTYFFLLWIKNFHQAVRRSKRKKKRKMTREQRRDELFRISDHYGIKEDWGEFKEKLKGTFCAKPYPKSHNPSRFLFANACLLSRDTTWIFILSGRRKKAQ